MDKDSTPPQTTDRTGDRTGERRERTDRRVDHDPSYAGRERRIGARRSPDA